jgi:hypothetical protein
MKAAGAVNLQSNAWVLPKSARHEEFLEETRSFIQSQNGRAFIFMAKCQDPEAGASIVEMFNPHIDRDYTEFSESCQALLIEIEKSSGQKEFDFSELDELEEDLQKLTSWLRKIKARDFFKNPKGDAADVLIGQCRKNLQAFEKAVYANEGLEIPEDSC